METMRTLFFYMVVIIVTSIICYEIGSLING